tara:strand:+ start:3675 stop:5000 length:1326 start_codon:yes stop_codon:yes gene_type:complete
MSKWTTQTLRSFIGSPISGSRPSGGAFEDTEGVPSLGGENIMSEGGVDYSSFKKVPESFYRFMPKGHLKANDVLINKDGAQTGKVGLYDGRFEDAAVNEHIFIMRSVNEAIDQSLLYYFLLLGETQAAIARRITGSAQPGLNSQFVDAVSLTVPICKQQQRRIAEILSTVDDAIEATEALIAKQQQIKAGLMHDLFTRGVWTADSIAAAQAAGSPAAASAKVGQLRPPQSTAPELYKDSPLGWIPKDWEVKVCSSLCKRICVGIVIQPAKYYQSSGVPAFRSANVRESGLTMDKLVYISKESNAMLSKSQVKAGDVLSVRTGYPGTSAVVPPNCAGCNTVDILISTPTDEISSDFLCAWINSSSGKNQVLSKQGGLAQQHFNVAELRKLKVILPSSLEQDVIVERFMAIELEIQSNQVFRTKLQKQKQGLMQDLLSGEVSV